MTRPGLPVFFLCECAACAHSYAVLTVPSTDTQLWFDRRYYPNNPQATVSGDGYHCPWCGEWLSGTPGILAANGDWVTLATVDTGALN